MLDEEGQWNEEHSDGMLKQGKEASCICVVLKNVMCLVAVNADSCQT
ncbi:MAG: hypothetical protein UDP17_06120 [Treponema sp.]|nr:hypothetical protein [uncultured Treponema sp.]MEE0352903.1 hypothetical protein [Treponema sp.]